MNRWSGPRVPSEELCLTLLTRMLTLLPLALHLTDAMPPRPGNSFEKFLLLQCTFASLWKGINLNHRVASNWQCASARTFSKLWVRLLKTNYLYLLTPLPQTPASSPENCCDCLSFRKKLMRHSFLNERARINCNAPTRVPTQGRTARTPYQKSSLRGLVFLQKPAERCRECWVEPIT